MRNPIRQLACEPATAGSPPAGMPRPARPAMHTVAELAARLTPAAPGPHAAAPGTGASVTGITHDSRAVRPGDLYAALRGARVHGAAFVPQAVEAGAVAVLTDPEGAERAAGCRIPVLVVPDPRAVLGATAAWIYGTPTDRLVLVGTTGTNGKTTVSYLVEAGFHGGGRRTGLIGTVETRVGDVPVTSARTTPEATDLQALFATMAEQGTDAVAMEVSSHALVLGRVDGTVFDVAVFTNLSQDHLDFHHDLEEYFEAKASLFVPARARAAVVNLDDAYGRRLADRVRGTLPLTTFSADGDASADWRAEDVRLEGTRSRFRAVRRATTTGTTTTGATATGATVSGAAAAEVEVTVPLPGMFNVANALAALAALVAAGVEPSEAADGMARLAGVPGRMERIDAGQPYLALVDYAHTPDAVETLLRTLRPLTDGRIIGVLGCGGDRDAAKRPLMGGALARLADVAVLTSDNPRSEDPLVILTAMREGAEAAGADADIVVEPDRGRAIELATRLARPGDTVVVAGKGHERGQDVHGEVRPFDDRVALRAAIRQVSA